MEINYSDQKVIKGKKSIFLAGPTPRDSNTPSWRPDVCMRLEKLGFDGVLYVPENSDGQAMQDYMHQVEWERDALTQATIILFWIPRKLPEMPAFTTNVEFGYWLHSGKVLYGRPDDSSKNRYLDWLYELDMKEKPYSSLEELLKEAVVRSEEFFDGKKQEILPLEKRKMMNRF